MNQHAQTPTSTTSTFSLRPVAGIKRKLPPTTNENDEWNGTNDVHKRARLEDSEEQGVHEDDNSPKENEEESKGSTASSDSDLSSGLSEATDDDGAISSLGASVQLPLSGSVIDPALSPMGKDEQLRRDLDAYEKFNICNPGLLEDPEQLNALLTGVSGSILPQQTGLLVQPHAGSALNPPPTPTSIRQDGRPLIEEKGELEPESVLSPLSHSEAYGEDNSQYSLDVQPLCLQEGPYLPPKAFGTEKPRRQMPKIPGDLGPARRSGPKSRVKVTVPTVQDHHPVQTSGPEHLVSATTNETQRAQPPLHPQMNGVIPPVAGNPEAISQQWLPEGWRGTYFNFHESLPPGFPDQQRGTNIAGEQHHRLPTLTREPIPEGTPLFRSERNELDWYREELPALQQGFHELLSRLSRYEDVSEFLQCPLVQGDGTRRAGKRPSLSGNYRPQQQAIGYSSLEGQFSSAISSGNVYSINGELPNLSTTMDSQGLPRMRRPVGPGPQLPMGLPRLAPQMMSVPIQNEHLQASIPSPPPARALVPQRPRPSVTVRPVRSRESGLASAAAGHIPADENASLSKQPSNKRKRRDENTREYDTLLKNVPRYDDPFPRGPNGQQLNFTATEINVFLPKLFHERDIAWRFQNNGLTAPAHRMMMRDHWTIYEPLDPKINSIRCATRDAIRGHGWHDKRSKQNKEYEKRKLQAKNRHEEFTEPRPVDNPAWKWNKKNHKAPEGWDHNDISVSNFMPDRIRENTDKEQRLGVLFTSLLRPEIHKLPQGFDRGDLTRAIEYARHNQRFNTITGQYNDFLFPDHIHEILGIIGYTQVTRDHLDAARVVYYKNRADQDLKERRKAARVEDGKDKPEDDNKREDDEDDDDDDDDDELPKHKRPRVSQNNNSASKTPARRARKLKSRALAQTAAPRQVSLPTTTMPFAPVMPVSQQHVMYGATLHMPPQPPLSIPLIRNEIVADDDIGDLAQIVCFAQRVDQVNHDWAWSEEEVVRITRCLEQEWITRLNVMLDQSHAPLWRDLPLLKNTPYAAYSVQAFTQRGMQQRINWRIDPCHAQALGHVNIMEPNMTLRALADLVGNFQQYSRMIAGSRHAKQWLNISTEVLRGQASGPFGSSPPSGQVATIPFGSARAPEPEFLPLCPSLEFNENPTPPVDVQGPFERLGNNCEPELSESHMTLPNYDFEQAIGAFDFENWAGDTKTQNYRLFTEEMRADALRNAQMYPQDAELALLVGMEDVDKPLGQVVAWASRPDQQENRWKLSDIEEVFERMKREEKEKAHV